VNKVHIEVCRDLRDLSQTVAVEFIRLAKQSVAAAGQFAVALAGGSTPKGLYSLLTAAQFRDAIPWSQIHLLWGDERCVPPDDPQSNYRMVHETLLSKVPIPAQNIFRMLGEKNPHVAASAYEETIRQFFHLSNGEMPSFDLILLGLGKDGHTASLFPGSEALRETRRLVTAPYVEELKTHRLTLTLPVLNHGANIFFLVAGKDKAAALSDVLQGKCNPKRLPAQWIIPQRGRLVWFVDQAAATLLRKEPGETYLQGK
jgi:6-phosphogluconolactonase